MLDGFAAEWLKLHRHRATWGLVWILPLGLTVLYLVFIGVEFAGGSMSSDDSPTAESWMVDAASIWFVPASTFGRYLIVAFAAVAIAGEYGWNTWKLIVPHRSRAALIAGKFAIVLALLLIAYVVTGILMGLFAFLQASITDRGIPAGVSLSGLLSAHWLGFLQALPALLLTVGYAALAAVLTRSMVATLIVGIVIVTIEGLLVSYAPVLALYMPRLVSALFHALPGYHLANLGQWIAQGAPRTIPFATGEVVSLGWPVSLAVVSGWIVALNAATFVRFQRQDIN